MGRVVPAGERPTQGTGHEDARRKYFLTKCEMCRNFGPIGAYGGDPTDGVISMK